VFRFSVLSISSEICNTKHWETVKEFTQSEWMNTHVCLCHSFFLLMWCFLGSFGCWVCRIRVSWDRGRSLPSGFKLIPLITLFGFAWVHRVRSHHTFSGDLICRLKTSGFPVTLLFTCPLHSENNLVFGKCNWKFASNCTSLGTELSVKRILEMLNHFLSIILKGKFFRVTLNWCKMAWACFQ
jgi:hypothetical protein